MEYRDFALRIKTVDDAGKFTGFASTYGEPADLFGDVVEKGAFTQAINSQGHGYPLLLAHKSDSVLGIAKIEDAENGLLTHATVDLDDPIARAAFNKIRMHALKGLSIGFLPAPGKVQYTDTGRILKEIRLFEISLTPTPANQRAQVFQVKSVSDARLLLQHLQPDEVEGATIDELKAIQGQLARLLAAVDPAPEIDPGILGELNKLAAVMRA